MLNSFHKYFVLFGAFLIELTLGYLYSSGNLQMVIIAYMKNNSYSGGSVNEGNTAWIFGAVTLGTGATLSLGGYLELKFGAWVPVLIGSWFMSLNFALMYFTLKSYLSVVIITFGLFGGFGVGIAYGVALSAAAKSFSKHRGLIFGITISGVVLSTMLSKAVQSVFFRDYSKNTINRLPEFFTILSLIFFIIQMLAALLIKMKRVQTLNDIPVNYEAINSETNEIYFNGNSIRPIEIAPHKLIFEYDFWNLWLLLFLVSGNNHFMVLLKKKYFDIVKDNSSLIDLSIILSIFNCLGRIFWGYLFDNVQFKKIMIILNLMNAIFIGTLPVFIFLKYEYKIYAAIAWFSILHFLFGGHFAVFPSICAKLFGMKYFTCNYGMIYTSCSVSSTIISVVLNSIELQNTQMSIIFGTGGMLSLLATLISILFRGKSLIIPNM